LANPAIPAAGSTRKSTDTAIGRLEGDLGAIPAPDWGSSQRIRFLWATSPVPTSGNPPVNTMRPPFGDFRLISREKSQAAGSSQAHGFRPYYCIASACELWFERLDFDAF